MFFRHIYSPAQQLKKIFFKVFKSPNFCPVTQSIGMSYGKRSPGKDTRASMSAGQVWEIPHHFLPEGSQGTIGNTLCLFWMCEAPVKLLYTCLSLNICSYALPTCFSLHRATSVGTCNSGLVLAKKMKENNFIHH